MFMVQLPPPVHGAALRNKSLVESEVINSHFNVCVLPLQFVDELKDIGRFSFKKLGITLVYGARLLKALCTRRIDLAYFTMSPAGFAFYRDMLFISLLKLFGKKVLLHFRVKGIRRTVRHGLGRVLVRYAFRNSHIVCLSRHHLEDMQGYTSRTPFIVPNGIKVEPQALTLPAYTGTERETPTLLFLSNLMRTKGIYELVEALHMLKNGPVGFKAFITGKELDISYEDLNRLLREKGLADIVTVTGPKYGEDKWKILSEADIFVFPTYFELFPGVLLEAMQFGRPIISTTEGSIPEMIDHNTNGILVPPQDAAALADAIAALLKDPERRVALGAAARKKFFEAFTLDQFERNMQAVFSAVLHE